MVEPFLAGVVAERQGSTSANFAALLLRSFLLGTPSVPSLGVSRLPELMAARLAEGSVRLDVPGPRNRHRTTVETDGGEVTGAAVVVATDPPAAAALTGEPTPPMKALTTFWHTAPEPPTTARLLHLDADARGPVINTAVLTTAAPTYAPAGRPLIATTVLGADGSSEAERVARAHAGVIYGVVHRQRGSSSRPMSSRPPCPPSHHRCRHVGRSGWPSGAYVCGDHRDTASIQGALVSGRRAARAVLTDLGVRCALGSGAP